MIPRTAVDEAYQALGEFVIVFQWVESKYREIGWFILDPDKKSWPPMRLRSETNQALIDKVTALFVELTETHDLPSGAERAKDFKDLAKAFHDLRRYRNRLMHSTFIELKSAGEVQGYIRANPKIVVDPDTGDLVQDMEDFTADSIRQELVKYSKAFFTLAICHTQLIHWQWTSAPN